MGQLMLLHNSRIANNLITEIIRNLNATKIEHDYTRSQLRSDVDYINLEARNTFSEGISTLKLKFITGYNYHGKRHLIINKELVKRECPRCL